MQATTHTNRRGFTLTELMIAVLLLIVVILASAKIFGIAGEVTSTGQATASIIQEAAVIERQLRDDFANLEPGGFFAIRSVAIRNDVHGNTLLDPARAPDDIVRCDQLVFFRRGLTNTQVFVDGALSNRKEQGTSSRVYYGHTVQGPNTEGLTNPTVDLAPTFQGGELLVPWALDPAPPSLNVLDVNNNTVITQIDGSQPTADDWLLARQSIMLADDGGDWQDYGISNDFNSMEDIWSSFGRNSRRDIAASHLADIRRIIQTVNGDGVTLQDWEIDGRDLISQAVYWPRGERVAPTMDRMDHAITTPVIASSCSSFRVEWTWADGEGGVGIGSAFPQPWFGLTGPDTDARPLIDWFNDNDDYVDFSNSNIDPLIDIERLYGAAGGDVYEAYFGYDRNVTPWPTAVRITMTLNDANATIDGGREFQFVIRLPEESR